MCTLLSTILGQKKGPNFPKLLNFLPYFRSEGKSTVSYKCWMILEGYLWVVRGPYGANQERVQLGWLLPSLPKLYILTSLPPTPLNIKVKQFEQFNQGFCSQAMEDLRCFASRGRAIGLLEVCQAERGGRSLAPLASLQTRRQDCYMNVK